MDSTRPDGPVRPADQVAPAEHVIFRGLDDEAILLDLETGEYFGLDPVGRRVWELMETDGGVAAIVAGLVEEYEVTPEQAQQDVLELLETMRRRGLLSVRQTP